MILDSFLEERAKIAAAGGKIDVRALHRKNLEDQKGDLEGSMKRSAYPKGIGIGALMGGSVPALMGVGTALNDMEAAQRKMNQRYIADVFEKAIKGDETLVKDLTDGAVKERARLAANYYLDLPDAIRNNDGEYVLRAIRRQYTDPGDQPAWVGQRGSKDTLLQRPITYTQDGRPVFSKRTGDFFNEMLSQQNANERAAVVQRELDNWRARPYLIGQAPQDVPTVRLPAASGLEDHARAIQDEFIGSIEKAIKETGVSPTADVGGVPRIPHAVLVDHSRRHARGTYRASPLTPYHPPHALGESTPSGREIVDLLGEIQKRHGKVPAPDDIQARISAAADALKKSKKALIASAAMGGILGGITVRRKRKAARALQA